MSEEATPPPPPPPPPPTSAPAFATSEVLFQEYRLIWGEDEEAKDPEVYCRKANGNDQAALCLSGGGIRSAAFALGVLQVLSRARLLTGFHYLSTVSGGGYIGCWLQRWIHEEEGRADAVMDKLRSDKEPDEVKRLRENSNFITPRVGIRSNDTWTAVAISVRNIIVNWLLFAPLLLLIALLPNLFLESVSSIRNAVTWDRRVLYGLLALLALCIARATFATVRLLPSYRFQSSDPLAPPGEGDALLGRRIVYPLVAWSVVATLTLSAEQFNPASPKETGLTYVLFDGGLDIAVVSLAGMVAGLLAGGLTLRGDRARTLRADYWVWPMTFLVTAGWVAFGATLFDRLFPRTSEWSPVLLTVFGPLWFLTATHIGSIVFAAFRESEGPSVRPDDDREWVARVSATKIKPMLFWGILAPSVLLLNRVWGLNMNEASLTAPGFVAFFSGLVAIAGGRSEHSGATTARNITARILKLLPLSAAISVATLLFVVALLMIFGRLEIMFAALLSKQLDVLLGTPPQWLDPKVVLHLAVAAILFGLLVFFGRQIQVNRFSLNGFYRNRLARAFLGAARRPERRQPDPFTGFDSADNVRMHLLTPRCGERAVLYPVVNVALNVTATENLAWQERKAEPFVFTPQYCGSGMLSREGKAPSRRTGAFVTSTVFGGQEPDLALGQTSGVTLATAMSISGAAASPNMGYNSSPATAFLMTLFNVRLGAWLPNPARAESLGPGIGRSSPVNSISALISELTGSTHDRGPDVYLSDGGHFENLGLYEMIRRRCRYIVVSDAGADPTCSFADLGNAVRKVKIDFDVNIRFGKLHIASRDEVHKPDPQLSWALGTIDYPEAGCEGWILYIKPSYIDEGLPVDVISYAKGSSSFPHESTADQFFSESQFESYRRLADFFVADLVAAMPAGKAGDSGPRPVSDLFDALKTLGDAPRSAAPKVSGKRPRGRAAP
ncbi:MAG TPA: patatin-like phospholipase family protein [Allosphingosinicella sp.]|nr:patatin-like phospholipase family protein [Allosphingosinicella sp.]